MTRKLAIGEEPKNPMAGYSWLTELAFGRPGRRVCKRHADGLCCIVHVDPSTNTIRGVRGSATPPTGAAFEAVVDRWVPEYLARALIGPAGR